jgi:hypothetical protein
VRQFEGRIQELQAQLAAAPRGATPRAVTGQSEQERERAREALRRVLDRIIIPSGDGPLRVVGNLGEMLTAATGWDGTALAAVVTVGCGGPLPL